MLAISQIILYINKYIIEVLVRGDGEKNKNLYGTPERDRDSKRELEIETDRERYGGWEQHSRAVLVQQNFLQ